MMSPGYLKKLAIIETPVKDHQLESLGKTLKKLNNNNNNNMVPHSLKMYKISDEVINLTTYLENAQPDTNSADHRKKLII